MKVLLTSLAVLINAVIIGQETQVASQSAEDQSNKVELKSEKAQSSPVRVFVLAGQSNMQGHGKIYDGSTGAVGVLIASFMPMCDGTEMCDFTFEMADSYGDGWNGWEYDFVQNGVVMATETLDGGSEGTVMVSLQDGITCDIVVNTAGAYGSEVSWVLISPMGVEVASMTGANEDYPSPNTLLDVMENDDEGLWPPFQTDGEWDVLENAYLYFENGQGTIIHDHVSVSQGANPELIGPELMFAHQLDAYYEEPILIIKTAWGGLSLAEDFRPPSAGGTTGPYYNEMLEMVEYVTNNIATEFPDLGDVEFELSGFAWFQGWNDAASDDFLNEYESNLHHLVNDIRNDLAMPTLPVVIANSGQGGYENHTGWTQDIQEIVAVAQENVGCDDEQYGGTVGFVNTKPFFMPASESPDDAGFHFHNNARTFLNVGKSIGDEMILAINNMAFCEGFTSIPNEEGNASGISIFPNPTSSKLTIDLGEWSGVRSTVKMFDLSGKLVLEQQLNSTQVVDVSTFAKGMYIIEIETNDQVVRRQLVVD